MFSRSNKSGGLLPKAISAGVGVAGIGGAGAGVGGFSAQVAAAKESLAAAQSRFASLSLYVPCVLCCIFSCLTDVFLPMPWMTLSLSILGRKKAVCNQARRCLYRVARELCGQGNMRNPHARPQKSTYAHVSVTRDTYLTGCKHWKSKRKWQRQGAAENAEAGGDAGAHEAVERVRGGCGGRPVRQSVLSKVASRKS